MLGRAYEYLIKKFADDAGAKAGEFLTPPEVLAGQRGREVRHEAAGQLDTATQVARMERRTGGKHACPAWTDRRAAEVPPMPTRNYRFAAVAGAALAFLAGSHVAAAHPQEWDPGPASWTGT